MSRFRIALACILLVTGWTLSVPVTYAQAAQVTCNDGTASKGGKGACSHHGGVKKGAAATDSASTAASPAPSTATSPPPAAPPANTTSTKPSPSPSTATTGKATKPSQTANAGAPTAKCKDGTMSYSKHHTGTCSHHGGVQQWLDKQ